MPSPVLRDVLQALADGRIGVDEAMQRVDTTAIERFAGATVDIGRAARCRFGEVIYGEGKSTELIAEIARRLLGAGQAVLITRVDEAVAGELCQRFSHHRHCPEARTLRIASEPIPPALPLPEPDDTAAVSVAVVTAGSTDRPVAAEVVETLGWVGVPVDWIEDVGVAGPQRLLAVLPRLHRVAAVVVVAGMEGALASMVGGLVGCPVIAVPTSVGYGANFGGLTPLLGMLTSCAAGVSVVGIDAGFKGGYVAGLFATALLQRCR